MSIPEGYAKGRATGAVADVATSSSQKEEDKVQSIGSPIHTPGLSKGEELTDPIATKARPFVSDKEHTVAKSPRKEGLSPTQQEPDLMLFKMFGGLDGKLHGLPTPISQHSRKGFLR